MRVIWIDPGETVGWATAEVCNCDDGMGPDGKTRGVPRGPHLEVLEYGNTKLKRFALALHDTPAQYDVIGVESYHIRPDKLQAHAGSDVPTLQLVGMIRLSAWVMQRRTAAAGYAPVKLVFQPATRQSYGRGAARLVFNDDIRAAIAEADAGPHDDGHYASALLHLAAWFHDTYGEAA